MDWLNCNKCGILKSENRTTEFFCGSCSHVLCGNCSNLLNTCPIDNRPFRGVAINSSMPKKLQPYFDDPVKLLATWQKSVRFQFEQRTISEPLQFAANVKKIRQIKEELKLFEKTKKILDEGNEKETKRNNKIKAYLRHCHQKRINQNRSIAASSSSTSETSSNFTSAHGESGVDLQFDDSNMSN